MSAQLPSLSQILHKGASGGHLFANIIKLLFEAEAHLGDGFLVQNFDDCAGDIDGADAFVEYCGQQICVQIKFFPSPLKNHHKSLIKKDFEKYRNSSREFDEWWLITPDDLSAKEFQWFSDSFGPSAKHKGESYLSALFFRQPEVGAQVYTNHSFRAVLKERNTPVNPEGYFKNFLVKGADIDLLFAKTQPTYFDCKQIFADEWWEIMGDIYNEFFRQMTATGKEREKIQSNFNVTVTPFEWSLFQRTGKGPFPQGLVEMKDRIKSEVIFYQVDFHNGEDGKYGIPGWCYINERWVFFGKLFRFLRMADKIQGDDEVRLLTRLMKFMRMHKRLEQYPTQRLRLIANQAIRNLKSK